MKKLYLLLGVLFVLTLAAGCKTVPAEPLAESVVVQQPNVPLWLNDLPPADEIYGVGFANLQNESLAMQTATARAQRNAAEQIGSLIQAQLTDFAVEEGIQDDPRSIMLIENIQRNIVNMNLSRSSVNARDKMADGTWWVRVTVSKNEVINQVNSIVNNEAANYAGFRADQALRRLEYEINNAQLNPSQFDMGE